ncbi:MAG: 5'-3' exonuclease [Opitutaceae bacterium]
MKILLVDGFNLAYRCFFAIPALSRADGFPTNALHGWIKSLWKLIDQERPEATTVFFDLGGSERHLALDPGYKAQRPDMPEALERQIPHLKPLTRLMGLKAVERRGVESDDLLASEAISLAKDGREVLIVSSDKDFYQLVNDRISLMLPPPTGNPKLGWRRVDAAGVREKFGVPPAQIPDYLALVGDASDNIPGVPGVGPKKAAKWLTDHGSLEGVIAHAAELDPERFRQPVAEAAERLRNNLKMTTLDRSLPVIPVESLSPDPDALFKFLGEMEMAGTLADAKKRYGEPELF